MAFHTREALTANSTLNVWQHVVELILLLHQFLVRIHLLLIMMKDMAQKLLLLNHYDVVPPEKEPSRLSSALTATLRDCCRSALPSSEDFCRTSCGSRSAL